MRSRDNAVNKVTDWYSRKVTENGKHYFPDKCAPARMQCNSGDKCALPCDGNTECDNGEDENYCSGMWVTCRDILLIFSKQSYQYMFILKYW